MTGKTKLSEAEIEITARKLCEVDGHDPNDFWMPGYWWSEGSRSHYTPRESRQRWRFYRTEAEQLLRGERALQEKDG